MPTYLCGLLNYLVKCQSQIQAEILFCPIFIWKVCLYEEKMEDVELLYCKSKLLGTDFK